MDLEVLGKVRDGYVQLMEDKLGADNTLVKRLKFDSLDSKDSSHLRRKLSILYEHSFGFLSNTAGHAVSIIKGIVPEAVSHM